ncbi:TPA: phage tail protein [Citrobacter braakii]|nr:phage tail protein [Citrobacter braakii]
MSAGTLTLTNNSAAVSGSATAFTTELIAGDFIVATVGGIPYTLPVKTVNSNTSLTLVSNFTGPTQAGAAWSAVPRIAMNLVTAAVVAQAAEALRGLNYDKQNWQNIFSGTGNITVKLPDGSTWTGPAWRSFTASLNGKADKGSNSDITSLSGLTTALSIDQGGTGAKNASDARKNLGLKGAATFEVDTSLLPPGQTTQPLLLSALRDYRSITSYDLPGAFPLGISGGITSGAAVPGMGQADTTLVGMINLRGWSDSSGYSTCFQIAGNDNKFGYRPALWNSKYSTYYYSSFREIYHTANTTKASDGTLKAASPIVQIFHDGRCQLNEESGGCTVTRLAIGEYLIEGCTGLNADASWGGIDGGFDIPTDRNKQPRIWLDYKVNADGSVLVMTYHRVHPSAPPFAQNRIGNTDIDGVFTETVADGEPVDIPADSFVSVRVEMPEDSIWNRMQKETREAIEKAERERQQNQQDTQS